jgi:hypothetical protein
MSKYAKLSSYLMSIDVEELALTFAGIEKIIEFPLPKSAYTYPAWWSNQASPGHSQSSAWQAAGWHTRKVDLSEKKVSLFRVRVNAIREAPPADNQRAIASPLQPTGFQGRLTIAEAKAGLSAHFGVPVENVEITIKG